MKRSTRAPRPPKPPAARRSGPAPKKPARRPAPAPPKPVRPAPAETAVLALARALTAVTAPETSPGAAVTTALDMLALAFQAGAALPRALAHARSAALRDEARALALAWAREQL